VTTCLLITTFNRSALLRRSLERLQSRTLPDEILVIDDGGSDGCEQVCQSLQHLLPVRYLYNHQPEDAQCSLARNIGIKNTTCDLIVTSEPELLWDTDVLAQMLKLHAERPTEVISAGTVHRLNEDGTRGETTVGWVAPFTALYGRDWLHQVGGWDEGPWPDPWSFDDTDLLTRLRLSGHGQVIADEIHVTHQHHEPRWCRQDRNDEYFTQKGFDSGKMDHVVANQDRAWGVIRTREGTT